MGLEREHNLCLTSDNFRTQSSFIWQRSTTKLVPSGTFVKIKTIQRRLTWLFLFLFFDFPTLFDAFFRLESNEDWHERS